MAGLPAYVRHTRLDMDYLCGLTALLSRDPDLRSELTFRPNSSLYRVGGKLRYAESRMKEKSRSYHLVAVEETPYLADTLQRAAKGATLRALAEALVDGDITLADAEDYLQELVESQILEADLQPAVTGQEPIHDLIARLAGLPHGAAAARALEDIRDALAELDTRPLGIANERYLEIIGTLRTLPAKVELNRLFQTDLVKPAPDATLGPEIPAEILRAVGILRRLFAPAQDKGPLARFREAFARRYEDREVPLVEVLDEESGIGFESVQGPGGETSPLLNGLAFPGADGHEPPAWNALEAFLLPRLVELAKTDGTVLHLREEDLGPFEAKDPLPLPDAFSAMARVATASADAFDAGAFKVFLSGASGPSGARLLGRFCHGDPELTREVSGHLAKEEEHHPAAVFAEIVHLPEGRIGNVIMRPCLRGYEIPYLGRSGAPEDAQIPVTDLLVSVRHGRIVLRSRRLGKEVLPRLTNAHNYVTGSLGTYRFLSLLQTQGVAGGLGWSWGGLDSLPFLPRVEVGRVVLSLARWRVEARDWKAVLESEGLDQWKAIQTWRAAVHLPRLAVLVDGDNKLPVDFSNLLSVEAFLDLVAKRPRFVLEEFFPDPSELSAEGPEGAFVHELVVPFTRPVTAVRPAHSESPRVPAPALPRSFQPGSEWLYVKLYTGQAGVDQLLRERLGPVVKEAMELGAADGWFFIRYSDPDWHLRLRFHGAPHRLLSEVLPRIGSACGDLVHKVVVDTYEREMERYGGDPGMLLSEQLFQADSEAVLAILETYAGDRASEARWRLCVKGMDLLLDDLGYSLEARLSLMESLRHSFLGEFKGKGRLEHQLGMRYREHRGALEALLDPDREGSGDLGHGVTLLRRRSGILRPVGAALRDLAMQNSLDAPLDSLAGSFLHMHANRLLRAAARAQEMVMYDFLARTYASRAVRLEKGRRSDRAPAGQAT